MRNHEKKSSLGVGGELPVRDIDAIRLSTVVLQLLDLMFDRFSKKKILVRILYIYLNFYFLGHKIQY